jgi:2-polyprenyl-3-methyl-5-hydroxy-6-metoxy-1,4-benzoquinol methylase
MIQLAKENNPTADFQVMDCREMDQLTGQFDGIICGFCMPYLSTEDCTKLIKDSAHLLNKNGHFYFSAIEGDYAQSGYEAGSTGLKSYVYYYGEDYFRKELLENNFELVELIRKEYPKSEGPGQIHLLFIAKKK